MRVPRPRYGAGVRVVVDALAARTGGGLTYLRSLLPAARAADPELELAVVVSRPDLLPELGDATVVEVPAAERLGRRLAWEQSRLVALARDLDADLIFSPSELAPLRSELPVLLGFQNPNLFQPPLRSEALQQRLRFRALRAAASASARRADALVFVSEAFRVIAEARLPLTAAPRYTVTVGVDSRFSPDGGAGRFDALRPYVLCVSDVYAYKGLAFAVDVFARAAARQPGLRLVLAGRRVDTRESGRIDARIRAHASRGARAPSRRRSFRRDAVAVQGGVLLSLSLRPREPRPAAARGARVRCAGRGRPGERASGDPRRGSVVLRARRPRRCRTPRRGCARRRP